MRYRTRKLAAEYLTALGIRTSEQGLADKASDGTGPEIHDHQQQGALHRAKPRSLDCRASGPPDSY